VLARSPESRPEDVRLVARVVAHDPSAPPTLSDLRRWLWRRLPGYAWPATMILVDALAAEDPVGGTPVAGPATGSAAYLAAAWAEALGRDGASPAENYWQSFALLDVLAESAAAAKPIPPRQVMRNRTLEGLATDLAATRLDPGGEMESH
ncbi:MAG: hypothetical protein M3179_10260, partial [Actinomycetota bacterium]|nr:hypothetical protein [Actinomycetota bacterium]